MKHFIDEEQEEGEEEGNIIITITNNSSRSSSSSKQNKKQKIKVASSSSSSSSMGSSAVSLSLPTLQIFVFHQDVAWYIVKYMTPKTFSSFIISNSDLCKSFSNVDYINKYSKEQLIMQIGLHPKVAKKITKEIENELLPKKNQSDHLIPYTTTFGWIKLRKCMRMLEKLDLFLKVNDNVSAEVIDLRYAVTRNIIPVIDEIVKKIIEKDEISKKLFPEIMTVLYEVDMDDSELTNLEKFFYYCVSKGGPILVKHVYLNYMESPSFDFASFLNDVMVAISYENYITLINYFEHNETTALRHFENCMEDQRDETVRIAEFLMKKYNIKRNQYPGESFLGEAIINFKCISAVVFLITKFDHGRRDFFGSNRNNDDWSLYCMLYRLFDLRDLDVIELGLDACKLTKEETERIYVKLIIEAAKFGEKVFNLVCKKLTYSKGDVNLELADEVKKSIILNSCCFDDGFVILFTEKLISNFKICNIQLTDNLIKNVRENICQGRCYEGVEYLINRFSGFCENRAALMSFVEEICGYNTKNKITILLFKKINDIGIINDEEYELLLRKCLYRDSLSDLSLILHRMSLSLIKSKIVDWCRSALKYRSAGMAFCLLIYWYRKTIFPILIDQHEENILFLVVCTFLNMLEDLFGKFPYKPGDLFANFPYTPEVPVHVARMNAFQFKSFNTVMRKEDIKIYDSLLIKMKNRFPGILISP